MAPPPPPSQAGKFKPRQPRPRPTGDTSTTTTTIAVGSSLGAAAATAGRAATTTPRPGRSPGRRGGRGSRGGGRGGRGGRTLAAPTPVPQGQVFFTGTPAPTRGTATARAPAGPGGIGSPAAGRRRPTSVPSSGSSSSHPHHQPSTQPEEEVIAVLEEGVGSQHATTAGSKSRSTGTASSSSRKSKDHQGDAMDEDYTQGGSSSGVKRPSHRSSEGPTYDSDSTLEDEGIPDDSQDDPHGLNMKPLMLPFPAPAVPAGIGARLPPARSFYPSADPQRSRQDLPSTSSPAEGVGSPLVDVHQKEARQREEEGWFLVQFPTRLPPLKQQAPPAQGPESVRVKMEEGMTSEPTTTTTENWTTDPEAISTQPIAKQAFDNALLRALPGRLGKLLVYKSGKTVLSFEGPDGQPTVQMVVTEGLSCSFRQQAVVIDKNRGDYVALGEVHKTMIATPDLKRAFPS